VILIQDIIIGIDEAGRGPVLGPLVICAYAIEKKDLHQLKLLGAKDSKMLSKNKRAELYQKLIDIAVNYKTIHLSASEIDEMRKNASLNDIEQKIMIKAVLGLKVKPSEIYIDAADVKEERFGLLFKNYFPKAKIVSRHGADKTFPVVSAASIIAKVERDREIEKIKEKTGFNIGSGYPSDPKTKKFLNEYYKKHKKFPSFTRESWDTCKKIKEKVIQQAKINEYF